MPRNPPPGQESEEVEVEEEKEEKRKDGDKTEKIGKEEIPWKDNWKKLVEKIVWAERKGENKTNLMTKNGVPRFFNSYFRLAKVEICSIRHKIWYPLQRMCYF